MNEIRPPEKLFEVICITCIRNATTEQIPYNGLVNHNYIIINPTKLLIQYRCFNCGSVFELEVSGDNPSQHPPKNKADFKKKMGFRKERIKN